MTTTIYISVLPDQKQGVKVSSIEGHTQVLPGQSVAFPVTEKDGIIVTLLDDKK